MPKPKAMLVGDSSHILEASNVSKTWIETANPHRVQSPYKGSFEGVPFRVPLRVFEKGTRYKGVGFEGPKYLQCRM